MSETWFRIAPWSKAAKITEEKFERSTGSFLIPEGTTRVAFLERSSETPAFYSTK